MTLDLDKDILFKGNKEYSPATVAFISHDQLQDRYGIEVSAEMVSKITDRILPQFKEWQSRPLPPSIPLCLWTVSIIRCGKTGASSAGRLMWCWVLLQRVIRRSSASL